MMCCWKRKLAGMLSDEAGSKWRCPSQPSPQTHRGFACPVEAATNCPWMHAVAFIRCWLAVRAASFKGPAPRPVVRLARLARRPVYPQVVGWSCGQRACLWPTRQPPKCARHGRRNVLPTEAAGMSARWRRMLLRPRRAHSTDNLGIHRRVAATATKACSWITTMLYWLCSTT